MGDGRVPHDWPNYNTPVVNRDWNTEERHDRSARSECKSCGMKISLKKYSQRPGSASRQWLGNQKLLVRFRVIVESLPVNEQIPGDTETKNFGEPRYQTRVTMSERMIKFSLLWWPENRHLVTYVLQSVDRLCCRRDDGVKKDIWSLQTGVSVIHNISWYTYWHNRNLTDNIECTVSFWWLTRSRMTIMVLSPRNAQVSWNNLDSNIP
jgi:hypothetical protein